MALAKKKSGGGSSSSPKPSSNKNTPSPSPSGGGGGVSVGRKEKKVREPSPGEKEVAKLLGLSWDSQTLSSGSANANADSLKARFQANTQPTTEKPTVLFYTTEDEKSSKLYERTLNPAKNTLGCIYAQYVRLVKIDVSGTTPEDDVFINNQTAPMLAFYNGDGTYNHYLPSRSINERAFCSSILKIAKQGTLSIRGPAQKAQSALRDIERLCDTRAKLQAKLTAKRQLLEKKTSSSGKSSLTRQIEALEEDLAELDQELTDLKKILPSG